MYLEKLAKKRFAKQNFLNFIICEKNVILIFKNAVLQFKQDFQHFEIRPISSEFFVSKDKKYVILFVQKHDFFNIYYFVENKKPEDFHFRDSNKWKHVLMNSTIILTYEFFLENAKTGALRSEKISDTKVLSLDQNINENLAKQYLSQENQ